MEKGPDKFELTLTVVQVASSCERIEKALGKAICTAKNPYGPAVYYDVAKPKPWRISDDWESKRFATVEEAISAAEAWANSYVKPATDEEDEDEEGDE